MMYLVTVIKTEKKWIAKFRESWSATFLTTCDGRVNWFMASSHIFQEKLALGSTSYLVSVECRFLPLGAFDSFHHQSIQRSEFFIRFSSIFTFYLLQPICWRQGQQRARLHGGSRRRLSLLRRPIAWCTTSGRCPSTTSRLSSVSCQTSRCETDSMPTRLLKTKSSCPD